MQSETQQQQQQQQEIYITQMIFSLKPETLTNMFCSSNIPLRRIIQIVLSNNILCVINNFHIIEFFVYNNTLQFDTDIVCDYTFPKNLFAISNDIIELLIQDIKFYNQLIINPKEVPMNISFDNILSNTCPNNVFNIYHIYILQQIFNLPTNILNFTTLHQDYNWFYDFAKKILKTNNLKKYHIFNYFKSIISNKEYSNIFTENILDIIMKFL